MKRVLILIAILLFGIGFEVAAAPVTEHDTNEYAAATAQRPKPRRKRVRRQRYRRTYTYIPYLPNSRPIPHLRLTPAQRRRANRMLLEALIN